MNFKMPDINFRDPKVQMAAVGIFLFLGVNYLYFFSSYLPFFYQPKKAEVQQHEERYRKLAIEVAEAKRASEDLRKLEKELVALHKEWEVALASLPEKREIASLLRRVTLAGERSGIRFQLFEPQTVVYHGVYDEHPVNVKVEGGFHEIGTFFGRLNNMDRVVHVSSISLEGERNDEDASVVRGEMKISAFTVPSAPAVDADGEATVGSSPSGASAKAAAKAGQSGNTRVKGKTNGRTASTHDSDE
ncbi:MAG: type 4a pilus biogenesis protein PilO [Gemmatimonadetes bacterium]|nr:type 4a pilus biogenesis protein PilO [Gemmatimonadota bacterium]